jgi:hypothetical protein
MSNGNIESYEIFWNFCEESLIDTIYLDSNNQIISKLKASRYTLRKVDKCLNHKYYYTYDIVDNKMISQLEIYFNDTVYQELDKVPISTEKYIENQKYYREIGISDSTVKFSSSGTVYLDFLILKNGKIDYVRIIKGVDKFLNADALKFVSNMPDWIPGQRNEKKVISKEFYSFDYRIW